MIEKAELLKRGWDRKEEKDVKSEGVNQRKRKKEGEGLENGKGTARGRKQSRESGKRKTVKG